MGPKILINAIEPEECRIAKIQDNKLKEFHIMTFFIATYISLCVLSTPLYNYILFLII